LLTAAGPPIEDVPSIVPLDQLTAAPFWVTPAFSVRVPPAM